jgi:hypothetical protein
MVDYDQLIQNIINSITNFVFEFDIEQISKEMKLCEVSDEELKNIGQEKIEENFNKGKFIIKRPDGKLIDIISLNKLCKDKNIKEPAIILNPNFKYVRWEIKKDYAEEYTMLQIKNYIKNQLKTNSNIDILETKKALIKEELKNRKIEGYIIELPILTSNYIQQGKFCIQATCTHHSAIQLLSEVLEGLESESKKYINRKIKRDKKNAIYYLLFVLIIAGLWILSNFNPTLPKWMASTIAFILFFVPLAIMQSLNLSFIKTILSRKKAEMKYQNEFNNEKF